MKVINELNTLVKKMMGNPMNIEQLKLLEEARARVKSKEITVEEAHQLYAKKIDELSY